MAVISLSKQWITRRIRRNKARPIRPLPLGSEMLEDRQILAAGPDPPEVLDVLLSGQAWSPQIAPVSLVSGSDSREPLPWINSDRLDVVFSKDVEVDIDSLTLVGVNTGQYFPSGFGYDTGSSAATWTFT